MHVQLSGESQVPRPEQTFEVSVAGMLLQIGSWQNTPVYPTTHTQVSGAVQVPCPEHTLEFVLRMPLQTGSSHSGPVYLFTSLQTHVSSATQVPCPEQTLAVSVSGMPKHVV